VSQAAWCEKPTFMVVATKNAIIPPQMESDQVKPAKDDHETSLRWWPVPPTAPAHKNTRVSKKQSVELCDATAMMAPNSAPESWLR
jgi:hypothetical protein